MAKHEVTRIWKHPVQIEPGVNVLARFKRMLTDEFVEWEKKYFSYAQGEVGAAVTDANATRERGEQMLAWIKESLAAYVSLEPGELAIDGKPIETGHDIYDHYGSSITTMIGFMNAIWAYHRFEDDVRKKLLAPSDSVTTSDGQAKEAPGGTPEPTAESAASETSAPIADVSQAEPSTSSGATGA